MPSQGLFETDNLSLISAATDLSTNTAVMVEIPSEDSTLSKVKSFRSVNSGRARKFAVSGCLPFINADSLPS